MGKIVFQVVRVADAHNAAKDHEENCHHEVALYVCPEKDCPCKFSRCVICTIEWRSPVQMPKRRMEG